MVDARVLIVSRLGRSHVRMTGRDFLFFEYETVLSGRSVRDRKNGGETPFCRREKGKDGKSAAGHLHFAVRYGKMVKKQERGGGWYAVKGVRCGTVRH